MGYPFSEDSRFTEGEAAMLRELRDFILFVGEQIGLPVDLTSEAVVRERFRILNREHPRMMNRLRHASMTPQPKSEPGKKGKR